MSLLGQLNGDDDGEVQVCGSHAFQPSIIINIISITTVNSAWPIEYRNTSAEWFKKEIKL